MKKLLSLLLAVSMFTAAAVYAETPRQTDTQPGLLDYTVPNTTFANRNKIGVNLGQIKVVFNCAVTEEMLNNIDFKEEDGTEPLGGIIKSIDKNDENGQTVILKFGELKENTKYYLTSGEETVEYETIKKDLIEEDFDDWSTGEIDLSTGAIASFNENPSLYYLSPSGGKITVKEEDIDKYIEVENTSLNSDLIVGARLEDNITDGYIVSFADIKYSDVGGNDCIGGIQGWNFVGQGNAGMSYSELDGFTANNDGFYNTMIVTKKINTVLREDSQTQTTADFIVDAYDLTDTSVVSRNSKFNKSAGDSKIHTSSIIKMYHQEVQTDAKIMLTYYRAGLYTIPEPLGEVVYDSASKTAEFIVNTDIDASTLNFVKAVNETTDTELSCEAAYNPDSRKMTVTLEGDIYYQNNIKLDLSGVKSADGVKFVEPVNIINDNEGDVFKEMQIMYFTPDPELYNEYTNTLMNHIGVNQEKIKIVFDKELDKNTLSGITFKDTNGNLPAGGIVSEIDSADVSGRTVIVSFGELKENEEYTLTIPTTVKSVDKEAIAKRVTKKYTTASKVLLNEDFDDWETGSLGIFEKGSAKQLKPDTNLYIYNKDLDTEVFIGEENGDKYLKVTADADESVLNVGSVYPYMSASKIVTMAQIKANGIGESPKLGQMRLGSLARDSVGIDLYNDLGIPYPNLSSEITENGYKKFTEVTVSENIIPVEGENDKFTLDCTNGIINETGEIENYSEKTLSCNTYTARINSISYLRNYKAGAEEFITSVNSGFYMIPGIVGDAEYDKQTGMFSFTANTDIDTATLENISVSSGEKSAAVSDLQYDSKTRKVSFKISDIEDDTEYIVSAKKVKSADGLEFSDIYTLSNTPDYTFEEISVKDVFGEETLFYNNNSFTVTGKIIKNTSADENAILFVALYNPEGRLTGVQYIRANGNETPVNMHFDISDTMNPDWKLSYFIWNDAMKPHGMKESVQ